MRGFKEGVIKNDCESPDLWLNEQIALENQDTFDQKKGGHIKVAEEEIWIQNANCYHLAAKFNPRALYFLLNMLGKDTSEAFGRIFKNGTPTPMHVAAFNLDSISIW